MTANLFVDSLSRLWDDFLILLPKIGTALVVLLIFYLVARIARFFIGRYLGKLRVSEIAVQLISRAASVTVVVIGVMVSLGVMGINAVALMASAGLMGVALGFALKGVIENFAAGLVVIWQRPFETGDTVIIGEVEGEVEEVRVRDTVIRMYDGRLAFVPNASIFSHEVVNNTSSGRRRLDFQVGVAYGDDISKALRAASEALRGVEGVLDDPAPMIVVREFEESSVALQVYFWIEPLKTDFLAVKSRAIEAVKGGFEEAGVEIPFPIVTVRAGA